MNIQFRDSETIRAYLEELLRARTPVHLGRSQTEAAPFRTTLERVTARTKGIRSSTVIGTVVSYP